MADSAVQQPCNGPVRRRYQQKTGSRAYPASSLRPDKTRSLPRCNDKTRARIIARFRLIGCGFATKLLPPALAPSHRRLRAVPRLSATFCCACISGNCGAFGAKKTPGVEATLSSTMVLKFHLQHFCPMQRNVVMTRRRVFQLQNDTPFSECFNDDRVTWVSQFISTVDFGVGHLRCREWCLQK